MRLTTSIIVYYCKNVLKIKRCFFYRWKYKVVQIWPGQTVTCLDTNRPGHIWTTLYVCNETIRRCKVTVRKREFLQVRIICISRSSGDKRYPLPTVKLCHLWQELVNLFNRVSADSYCISLTECNSDTTQKLPILS